ncbi:DUF2147 domain-containing protein [Methylophilus methylotrophus]|uniref:DUF2147 domain-containing protein n=1 Tax=Methylophilus methylotrophus TaxID=17 RepID=UPI0009D977A5|nr:DUF2147 domain-containing protein [Methylophilus methylotrophus]
MKVSIHAFITHCLSILFLSATSFVYASNTPEGLWKAHDDKGMPTGYIRVKGVDGVYTGVIEKGLETDREDKYCHACKDERKGQKLVGMTMMKNVKANGDAYEGDEILDPFSGNTYRVKLQLKNAGNVMEVRGFIGLSLFGRTQVWQRVE